jgi:hypothetical protein
MTWRVEHGDCIEVMAALPEASIDAIVTDPPYGLSFMGRAWDTFDPATMARRVGRRDGNGPPSDVRDGRSKGRTTSAFANDAGEAGAYDFSARGNRAFQQWCEEWAREALRVLKPGGLLAFGGTRTYHRLASGIEDAGFEIRDKVAWFFGQGFPKSLNIGDGRGTALKPGHEPVVMARKPLAGTVVANVEEHGTGALNIDACRIEAGSDYDVSPGGEPVTDNTVYGSGLGVSNGAHDLGRWPANVALDEAAAAMLDEQSGQLVSGANPTRRGSDKFRDVYGDFAGQQECERARGIDIGGAARFFYCAKPDPVLDPFTGSGTTGCAAALEGRDFVGIERGAGAAGHGKARRDA